MSSFFSRFVSKTTEKKPVKLTPAQAQQKMTNEPVTIIDVRRPDEFAEGHIPGAINLPNETIIPHWPRFPMRMPSCWCIAGQAIAARRPRRN